MGTAISPSRAFRTGTTRSCDRRCRGQADRLCGDDSAARLAVTVSSANVSGISFGYNAPAGSATRSGETTTAAASRKPRTRRIAGTTVQLYKDTPTETVSRSTGAMRLSTPSSPMQTVSFCFRSARRQIFREHCQAPLSGLVLTTTDDQPSVAQSGSVPR